MRFKTISMLVLVTALGAVALATTPVVTNLNPVTGLVGSQVQIIGSGFGASQGTSTVSFSGTNASVVSWSDTQVTVVVPSTAATGQVWVIVGGVSSSATMFFNVPPPRITGISPASGTIGTQFTVTGSGFQATKGSSSIVVNNMIATVTSWSDTQIVATTPAGTTGGFVRVVVNGVTSNQNLVFGLPNPIVTGVSPVSGPVGTAMQINGSGFGASQGTSAAKLNGTSLTVTAWSDTQITATVPVTATSGLMQVTVGGVGSAANINFTVPLPQVNSVAPATGIAGTQITVNGLGFQAVKGSSSLMVNGFAVTTTAWSDTQITGTLPAGVTTGPVKVTVNSLASNQDVLFIVPNPMVTGVSPTSGPAGSQITVTGTGFGATQGTSSIKINSVAATVVTWSDTQIVATVPQTLTGLLQVTVSNITSPAGIYFEITLPHVSSLSPASGVVGTQVTVTGSGFRASQSQSSGSSTITFNGQPATVVSWSDMQIVATVPAGAVSGPVTIGGAAGASNTDIIFSMPKPVISTISPSSGPTGTQVQINGSGFGATQGSSVLQFTCSGGITAPGIVSWSDTQIVATVPVTAISGSVKVISGGVTGNTNINFTVPAPVITAISPSSGGVGTQVTVTGSGFQSRRGANSTISVGTAMTVVNWSDTQIVATVGAGSTINPVVVTVNNIAGNQNFIFGLPRPVITGFFPTGGPAGTQIQIAGNGFGATQGASTIGLNNTVLSVVSWSDTQIVAAAAAPSGSPRVTVGGVINTSTATFTVTPLYVNSFSPNAGPSGTSVTVSGSGFGSSQGTSAIAFNNVTAAVTSWSDTQIVATVPNTAANGVIKVTVGASSSSSADSFTVGGVVVAGLNPAIGAIGTQVQINGSGFGSSQGTSTVTFNGRTATTTAWSSTQITATVPTSSFTGPVMVTAGGVASNSNVIFAVPGPVVTNLSPAIGPVSSQVQIIGANFGATQAGNQVLFSGISASVVSWSDTSITATVPSNGRTGPVQVSVGGWSSNNNLIYTVPTENVSGISPTSGVVGTQVTINGTGFHATQGGGSVQFNGINAGIVSWSDTQIVATVPAAARTGPVTVTVLFGSNSDVTMVLPSPAVTSLSPTSGPMGTQVQINGTGFGATQGASAVTFNGTAATIVNWSDTLITASVPSAAGNGQVVVKVGGVASTSIQNFNVSPPRVASISPSVAAPGSQVTIAGTGFHAAQGPGSVWFNPSLSASVVSWSDTQIVVTVPNFATTGGVSVFQNLYSNSNVLMTVVNPVVTGVSPTAGASGSQVQINGSGFGATQGTSSVSFNTITASVVSWSDTHIVATVPPGATSGQVKVAVSGTSSVQNVNFTVNAPRITSISPSSGSVGTNVTINGSGFQSAMGNGLIFFGNGFQATAIVSWSDTQIVVTVPSKATTGAVSVRASNSVFSNQDVVFTMANPVVTSVTPSTGPTGTQVQINGTGFGATQGGSMVGFNNVAAAVVSWSDTQIVAVVPAAAISGPVQITEGGVISSPNIYFNVPAPVLNSIAPAIGGSGNPVTIAGTGFQASQGGASGVSFSGGGQAAIKSWSDTQIVAVVPVGTTTGSASVTVNYVPGNYVVYTVPPQTITGISPTSGPVGTSVTVTGVAFGGTQGTSVLSFSGQPAASITSWSDTQIVGVVPVTAITGPVVVTVNGVNSNAFSNYFSIPGPFVSGISPEGGAVGTAITIFGSSFQANQRNNTVTFNGITATAINSWSDTQIVAVVPPGAATGPLLVTVNGVASYVGNTFEVPHPAISSITPPEAPVSGVVSLTGSGFGVIRDAYVTVNVGGIAINASVWTDTTLSFVVPAGAVSSQVTVTRFGVTSNGVNLTVEGAPTITGLSPSSGPVNSTVTINGTGFGSVQSTSTITFNGLPATVTQWGDTQITAVVPTAATTGPVVVTVASVASTSQTFTIINTVQVTDALGHTSVYTTAMLGGGWHLLTAQGSGCSSCTVRGVVTQELDANGNVLSSTDELGHKTSFTYDADLNMTSQSQPLDIGTTVATSYTYNSFGEPLTVTDPLGNVTTNTYDANGNLLTVTSPVPASGVAASVTQFAYDTKGQLTQITDPLGHITTLAYTPTGLIATITDAQSHVTTYGYDLRGNRTSVTDALNNQTTFTYDLANRPTKITYPDTTFVTFAYDTRGRRTSVTDQNGKVTAYAYDDADRLTSVTDAANNVTHYAYDVENNLLSITDAAGHTTSFNYDAFGRVTQTSFPSTLVESYVYDAIGNLISKTDRKAQSITYFYDALNRLTHKGYPDATGVDYVYDLAGKIKQVTDPTGVYGFAYDNMGRQVAASTQYSFIPGQTFSNTYAYDAESNRTSFTSPHGGTDTYAYDTMSQLMSITDSATGQFTFTYDALGRRTALNRPNGVNTSYGYNSLSRLLSVLHQNGAATLDGAGYTYDNAGNRTAKTNYLNSTTEQYTYDAIYQLTQVAQGATTTESYSYDVVGNRLSSLAMSPYAYNSSNQLISTPAATFTYDGNGNTLTKVDSTGTTQYAWDFENRLTSVVLPGTAGTVTFKYDPFGRRVQKSSATGTVNYLYDGSNSAEEVDSSGTLLARYAQGAGIDEALAEVRGGTSGFYEQDGLGSVTSLSGSASALADTYTYNSFGISTASTGTLLNPFQYTGRDYDTETGLRYYRARYYDPASGRFLSEDPLRFGGQINFYSYVLNDPINFADPFGLQQWPAHDHNEQETLLWLWWAYNRATAGRINGLQNIANYSSASGKFDVGNNEHANDTWTRCGRKMNASQFGNYLAGFEGAAYDYQYRWTTGSGGSAESAVYWFGLYYHLSGRTKSKWDKWDNTGRPDIFNGTIDGWSFHDLGSDCGCSKVKNPHWWDRLF